MYDGRKLQDVKVKSETFIGEDKGLEGLELSIESKR